MPAAEANPTVALLVALRPFAVAAARALHYGQPRGGVELRAVTRSGVEFELFAKCREGDPDRVAEDDELLRVQHMLDAREAYLAAGGTLD